MKLNGKIYLKQDNVINTLEDIIILLETGSYHQIAGSIKNIKPENAEVVAKRLASFQDMFYVFFKTEKYCKLDTATEMTIENLYDSNKEKVSLFSQGAYGVTIRSDAAAAEKYIFNTCLFVFMKKIKQFNGEHNN